MNSIEKVDDVWMKIDVRPEDISDDVCKFLDVSTTSFGRATHYNTREKQSKAEEEVHARLFGASRDLYQVLLALPGTTDRAKQLGIAALLGNQRVGKNLFLDNYIERRIVEYFVRDLPPQRMLKLFDAFRGFGNEFGARKSNSSRTKKLILRTILNSPRLELWVIKYRSKLQRILAHAWGRSLASSIGAIAAKKRRNDKENAILGMHVLKYIDTDTGAINSHGRYQVQEKWPVILECIAFLYGERNRISANMRLLRAFIDSKHDLSYGLKLPSEVIEGIRSTYHSDISAAELLRMRANAGEIKTRNEKKVVQKRVKAVGGKVDMDPLQYDAVDLYIYAFEVGADARVLDALSTKAKSASKMLPVKYDKLAIIVDASKSMEGSKEQSMRPLATALSIRDMLQESAEESRTVYCGGFINNTQIKPSDMEMRSGFENEMKIIRPAHETSLAELLLDSLIYEPDAIYVISDGYENSPAGRFGDVLRKAREIGIDIPVIHCNPVFAAEAGAVRTLCDGIGKVTTLPVRSPTAMGSGMLRGLIEADPRRGLNSVLKLAMGNGSPLFGLLER